MISKFAVFKIEATCELYESPWNHTLYVEEIHIKKNLQEALKKLCYRRLIIYFSIYWVKNSTAIGFFLKYTL